MPQLKYCGYAKDRLTTEPAKPAPPTVWNHLVLKVMDTTEPAKPPPRLRASQLSSISLQLKGEQSVWAEGSMWKSKPSPGLASMAPAIKFALASLSG